MDTEYKRKRVAKACQRCRSMKSKVRSTLQYDGASLSRLVRVNLLLVRRATTGMQ